jgi:hypothetical protein
VASLSSLYRQHLAGLRAILANSDIARHKSASRPTNGPVPLLMDMSLTPPAIKTWCKHPCRGLGYGSTRVSRDIARELLLINELNPNIEEQHRSAAFMINRASHGSGHIARITRIHTFNFLWGSFPLITGVRSSDGRVPGRECAVQAPTVVPISRLNATLPYTLTFNMTETRISLQVGAMGLA